MTTTPMTRTAPALPEVGLLTTALLAVGPVLSVAVLAHLDAAGRLVLPLSVYVATALLFWSPLPFSFAAVLLEAHRDAVLPGSHGLTRLLRGLVVLPVMLSRPASRVATITSLVGFAVGVVVGWPYLAHLPVPYLTS